MIQSNLLLSTMTELPRAIETNSRCIEYLIRFDYCSTEQIQKAKKVYLEYIAVQKILSAGEDEIEKLCYGTSQNRNQLKKKGNHKRIVTMKTDSCDVCGNPMTDILEIHHVIPLSRGGDNTIENFVCLCPNCHKIVHKCIDAGGIEDSIRDYYADNIEKLERIVRVGIGDEE